MEEPVTVYGYLIPLGPDGKDIARFPIKRQIYVIGSAEHVNIRIPSKVIHPWHASIVVDSSGGITIRNLHKSRHFAINGSTVQNDSPLGHLDVIQFGKYTFRFENPRVPVKNQIAKGARPLSETNSTASVKADTSTRELQVPSTRQKPIEKTDEEIHAAPTVVTPLVPPHPAPLVQEHVSSERNTNHPITHMEPMAELTTLNPPQVTTTIEPSSAMDLDAEPIIPPPKAFISESRVEFDTDEKKTENDPIIDSAMEVTPSQPDLTSSVTAIPIEQQEEVISLDGRNVAEEQIYTSSQPISEVAPAQLSGVASTDYVPYAQPPQVLEAAVEEPIPTSREDSQLDASPPSTANLDESIATVEAFEPINQSVMNGSFQAFDNGEIEMILSQRTVIKPNGQEMTSVNASYAEESVMESDEEKSNPEAVREENIVQPLVEPTPLQHLPIAEPTTESSSQVDVSSQTESFNPIASVEVAKMDENVEVSPLSSQPLESRINHHLEHASTHGHHISAPYARLNEAEEVVETEGLDGDDSPQLPNEATNTHGDTVISPSRKKADNLGTERFLRDFDPTARSRRTTQVVVPHNEKKKKKQAYCICRSTVEEKLIGCDGCEEWYHFGCIGITSKQAKSIPSFVCHTCNGVTVEENIALQIFDHSNGSTRLDKPPSDATEETQTTTPSKSSHEDVRVKKEIEASSPPPSGFSGSSIKRSGAVQPSTASSGPRARRKSSERRLQNAVDLAAASADPHRDLMYVDVNGVSVDLGDEGRSSKPSQSAVISDTDLDAEVDALMATPATILATSSPILKKRDSVPHLDIEGLDSPTKMALIFDEPIPLPQPSVAELTPEAHTQVDEIDHFEASAVPIPIEAVEVQEEKTDDDLEVSTFSSQPLDSMAVDPQFEYGAPHPQDISENNTSSTDPVELNDVALIDSEEPVLQSSGDAPAVAIKIQDEADDVNCSHHEEGEAIVDVVEKEATLVSPPKKTKRADLLIPSRFLRDLNHSSRSSQNSQSVALTYAPVEPTVRPKREPKVLPLYCVCQTTNGRDTLCCDICEEWYHFKCIGIDARTAKKLPTYTCHRCNGVSIEANLRLQAMIPTPNTSVHSDMPSRDASLNDSTSSAPRGSSDAPRAPKEKKHNDHSPRLSTSSSSHKPSAAPAPIIKRSGAVFPMIDPTAQARLKSTEKRLQTAVDLAAVKADPRRDLMYVDANGVSVDLGDEGRAVKTETDLDAAVTSMMSTPAIMLVQTSPNLKKRKSTSALEVEGLYSPKKVVPLSGGSGGSADAEELLRNLQSSYEPPLTDPSASFGDQVHHIVTQLLIHHGTLSHPKIVALARKHAPYTERLRHLFPQPWKLNFEAALGTDLFQRHPAYGHEMNLLWINNSDQGTQ